MPAVGRSFVSSFEERVGQYGSRRLYTWLRNDCTEEASLTFDELRERAVAVCIALRRQWGVGQGDRAMLLYPPGLDLLVAFFGCNYAAVIAVPYYPPVTTAAALILAEGLTKVCVARAAGGRRHCSSAAPSTFPRATKDETSPPGG